MAKIIIGKAIPRFAGSYELDSSIPMKGMDWRWIKKISGYMPNTIETGFEGDDPDLYIALAVVALHRAGKIRPQEALYVADVLLEADVDGEALTIDFTVNGKTVVMYHYHATHAFPYVVGCYRGTPKHIQ